MQVGNLVRLKNIPEVLGSHPHLSSDSVGLVIEWNAGGRTLSTKPHHQSGDGSVLWNGHADWDIQYEEDLEVISETR